MLDARTFYIATFMPYKDKNRQREYQRKWVADRRDSYTSGKTCEYCGKPAEDWHLDPSIKETHRIWSWSTDRIETELSKCVPVCKKCHQTIHNPVTVTHGNVTMYIDHKCRCDKCREANKLRAREYRRKLKERDESVRVGKHTVAGA